MVHGMDLLGMASGAPPMSLSEEEVSDADDEYSFEILLSELDDGTSQGKWETANIVDQLQEAYEDDEVMPLLHVNIEPSIIDIDDDIGLDWIENQGYDEIRIEPVQE